ncbi:hypothetical protein AVEN_210698-1 [Araneus ventricosus]|uniref:Caspase family p20 domain-containing protein n=1 Tax=Araneus ventricosus TaxID=182803 RepID=A0A4Y2FWW7_ARAVE|nr:hypothetical protein AVEN_210698-1 [Araneus ventricosus]
MSVYEEEIKSGRISTNYPSSDIKLYDIKKAKRVLFLSVVDKNIGKKDYLVRGAVHLRSDLANRNYSHKEFSNCFIKSEILKFLNQSSNQSGAKNSSEVDCLICYIAAYSRYDTVCDARGKKIYRKEIVEEFIGQLNKSFIGKPKIFIFLLCESLENEKLLDKIFYKDVEPAIEFGINTDSSGRRFVVGTDSVDGETDQSMNSTYRGLHTNTESTDGGCTGENLIPIHADILEICLTVPDWKHAIGPMNLFRDILKKSPTEDFLSLLTEFNCELVEKHNFYQMSKKSFTVTSTLTKTLHLP